MSLLSIADRLATRGRKADEAIAKHLEVARVVLPAGARLRRLGRAAAADPRRRAGPRAGASAAARSSAALLAAIAEARYAGEVTTADEAIALARTLV